MDGAQPVQYRLGFGGPFPAVGIHRLIPTGADEEQKHRREKAAKKQMPFPKCGEKRHGTRAGYSAGAGIKIFWPILRALTFTFGLASITSFRLMVFIPLALKAEL